MKVIKSVFRKIRNRGDISDETLDYFLVNNPKLGRLYLLPKIHKRLHNVPGRPVISNSSYFTENSSSFLDFHLKQLAQKVKSYIQDTSVFLKKIANFLPLQDDLILCTIDVVGLYPNVLHGEGLIAIRKALDTRKDKTRPTGSLIKLVERVLKNNIFKRNKYIFKQVRVTAIGTKMAPTYAILFRDSLEDMFSNSLLKAIVWWRYIDNIFMMWEHGEEELKKFLETLNYYHPTITFTAEHSRTKIIFLDLTIMKKGIQLVTDLYVKLTGKNQ